jgi:hypothetical protein
MQSSGGGDTQDGMKRHFSFISGAGDATNSSMPHSSEGVVGTAAVDAPAASSATDGRGTPAATADFRAVRNIDAFLDTVRYSDEDGTDDDDADDDAED